MRKMKLRVLEVALEWTSDVQNASAVVGCDEKSERAILIVDPAQVV
jgi:hypothetical protein